MDYDYVKYSDKWAEEYAESEKKILKRVTNRENNPIANEFQRQCKELYEAHKNRNNSFLSLFISESLAGLWQENK